MGVLNEYRVHVHLYVPVEASTPEVAATIADDVVCNLLQEQTVDDVLAHAFEYKVGKARRVTDYA